MSEQAEKSPASLGGTVSLGSEFVVRRLGFGAMRITGDGIWGLVRTPIQCYAFFVEPWSWASIS
jgi:hypothetical protein